ncbi:MAG: putative nucleotidyltransferase substrate binding domain-containing protein [Gaiellaceae bacterium]
MNTESIGAFLAGFAPFDALGPAELAGVAASAVERSYDVGESALVEDGTPSEHLFVVRSGSIELVHQGEVVDILGAGQLFGQPSLLTGLAPAFTVRAREPTVCLLIPREQAMTVFTEPAGAAYLARTLRSRLVQAGHVVHALPELGTIRVAELVDRPPIFCDGSTTIRRGAQIMSESHASAILVRDGSNLSILTDAVLRQRVIAEGISAENPVSRIVRPAVEVGPDRIAVDAVVEMLDAGTDHIVVVGREREVLGVLSSTDLAGLETRSPFALRHAILSAPDVEALASVAQRLPRLFLALLGAGIAPLDVGRVLSLQVDSLTGRLIELSIAERGPAPTAWAWLVLGSTARREFTLGSDIENALAYDGADEDVDAYFAQLAADVTDGLVRCGFTLDPNDVLASEELWRMTEARWAEVFRGCLDAPDRSHLIRANVAFDFRQVAGGLEVTPPLVAILRGASGHPDFVRRLARTATDLKPPLGFRGALVVQTKDAARGVDLKRGGAIPVTNLARFYALSNGITISSTVDRLGAAKEGGALDGETAEALREAFEIVMRLRLEHHAEQIEADAKPDNIVDPAVLPPLTRLQLREAFRAVAHAQKKLSVYVPLGI